MKSIKDEIIGIVIASCCVPIILPTYICYHFFYKEKSVIDIVNPSKLWYNWLTFNCGGWPWVLYQEF